MLVKSVAMNKFVVILTMMFAGMFIGYETSNFIISKEKTKKKNNVSSEPKSSYNNELALDNATRNNQSAVAVESDDKKAYDKAYESLQRQIAESIASQYKANYHDYSNTEKLEQEYTACTIDETDDWMVVNDAFAMDLMNEDDYLCFDYLYVINRNTVYSPMRGLVSHLELDDALWEAFEEMRNSNRESFYIYNPAQNSMYELFYTTGFDDFEG